MATARKKTIVTEVELILTLEEAKVLAQIMDLIGGSPNVGPRKLCDGIGMALDNAGVVQSNYMRRTGARDCIHFEDVP